MYKIRTNKKATKVAYKIIGTPGPKTSSIKKQRNMKVNQTGVVYYAPNIFG